MYDCGSGTFENNAVICPNENQWVKDHIILKGHQYGYDQANDHDYDGPYVFCQAEPVPVP